MAEHDEWMARHERTVMTSSLTPLLTSRPVACRKADIANVRYGWKAGVSVVRGNELAACL